MSSSLPSDRPPDRIVVVDALRGACFVFMTMDHFPGNPLARFSNAYYGPFGFFTAALGFVFLSGLVGGLVYERHQLAHGTRSMFRRILRRTRDLYVTQVAILCVLVAALVFRVGSLGAWHLDLISESPWKGFVYGSSLVYEPGYLGILPMYCLFLLLTPAVLWQFQKGNSRWVLGASALVWITSGLTMGVPADPKGVDFGAFSPLGYQFLFIVGLAFGTGQLRIERLSQVMQRWLLGSCLVGAAAFFVLRQVYVFEGPLNTHVDGLGVLFSSRQLGPLRLLSFAAFGVILYSTCRRVQWETVHSAPFRWLAFVGRHSLPVFAWSILVTYGALEFFPRHPEAALGLLGVIAAVASLSIPAQVRASIRQRKELPRTSSIVESTPTRRRAAGAFPARSITRALERYAGVAASREIATITPTSIGRSSDLRR